MADSSNIDVQLRFPAERGYLRLSRITATTIAADLDFDVEQLDDLRLAVDEAVSWLVDGTESGHVQLTLSSTGAELRIHGQCSGPAVGPADVDDLVHAVLGATVDDYEVGVGENGDRTVLLTKAATQ